MYANGVRLSNDTDESKNMAEDTTFVISALSDNDKAQLIQSPVDNSPPTNLQSLEDSRCSTSLKKIKQCRFDTNENDSVDKIIETGLISRVINGESSFTGNAIKRKMVNDASSNCFCPVCKTPETSVS